MRLQVTLNLLESDPCHRPRTARQDGRWVAAFPTTPSEITVPWLNRILDQGGFPEIRTIDLERLGETDSLVGLVFRVRFTFDERTDGPRSVVIKLPRSGERSELWHQWYASEVGFYRELAEHSGLRVPRAFYTEFDEATGDFVLVLEDFPDLEPGDNERVPLLPRRSP